MEIQEIRHTNGEDKSQATPVSVPTQIGQAVTAAMWQRGAHPGKVTIEIEIVDQAAKRNPLSAGIASLSIDDIANMTRQDDARRPGPVRDAMTPTGMTMEEALKRGQRHKLDIEIEDRQEEVRKLEETLRQLRGRYDHMSATLADLRRKTEGHQGLDELVATMKAIVRQAEANVEIREPKAKRGRPPGVSKTSRTVSKTTKKTR